MSLWDDVKQNLSEWYTVAADKTSEVAKIASRRYDKFGISRDIERQFSELGSLVYNGLQEGREGILDDPAVTALIGPHPGAGDGAEAEGRGDRAHPARAPRPQGCGQGGRRRRRGRCR